MTAATKNSYWEVLAEEVTAVSGVKRTGEELKKKWSCLKSEAKGAAVVFKKGLGKTGGGEQTEAEVSASQQRIINVIGPVCVDGITGGTDTATLLLNSLAGCNIYSNNI